MVVSLAYCFITDYKFNNLKHIYVFVLCFAIWSGLYRDTFSLFHMASAKASSAWVGGAKPTMFIHMVGKLLQALGWELN